MTINQHTPYYLGLAQWHHPAWYTTADSSSLALALYSKAFTSVEGNSSFYGLPSTKSIDDWAKRAHSPFAFCFKFPQSITHHSALYQCDRQVTEFLNRIAPLGDKTGVLWLQMNSQFSPEHLERLSRFLGNLAPDFEYGIEVRNLGFFDKADNEKRFNQILMQHGVNRVSFDTRALFAHPKNDPVTQEAFRAKPRMPVHVIATGNSPFIRFITPLDIELGYDYLAPWIKKVAGWIHEGKKPYLFFHTPDNQAAPQLAQYFNEQLKALCPQVPSLQLPSHTWLNNTSQTELF
ncbi:DUF72 domain-containing protein [Neptunomonas phycophila]|uniref:DUF72 domain-containing protein n=1 Tax=Neptunomonas TaxID=75687 RepID=UPI0023F7556C|nr:DUF72 domain-containing protein [Neptunomonas phycophila]